MFSVPHSEDEYQNLVGVLDSLVDEVGNTQDHKLAPVMETIGNLIETYENQKHEINEASPIDALKYLMLEHSLKQSDLKEIGSQGVVSEILMGKRTLNLEPKLKKSVLGFMFHLWFSFKQSKWFKIHNSVAADPKSALCFVHYAALHYCTKQRALFGHLNLALYPKAIKVPESTFIALGWLGLTLFRNRGFMQTKVCPLLILVSKHRRIVCKRALSS